MVPLRYNEFELKKIFKKFLFSNYVFFFKKVLNYAMNGPDGKDNCSKFVDILGLRTIFPLFMKTPTKNRKKIVTVEEHEGNF